MMRVTAVLCLALCLGAAVAAASAAAKPGAAAGEAALAALRTLTPPQKQAFQEALVRRLQEAARQLLSHLESALALDDAERAALLAAAREEEGKRPKAGKGEAEDEGEEPLVETIRRILREGLPEQGVPPLDPFRIDALSPLDVDVPEVLWLHAEIKDLSVDGLASFEDDVYIFSDSKLFPPRVTVDTTFNILIPRLRLRTDYKAEGYAEAGLDVWGEGLIELVLNRLRLKGAISIRTPLFGTATVEPCGLTLSARSLKLDIQGLFGGGLLSQFVGEIITEMANEVLDTAFDALTVTAEDEACGYLRSLTVVDMISLYVKFKKIPRQALLSPFAPSNVSAPAVDAAQRFS